MSDIKSQVDQLLALFQSEDAKSIHGEVLPSSTRPRALIAAQNDKEAILAWLARYKDDSPRTQQNYRKEVNRLYLWSRSIGKTFAELTHEDVLAFKDFLADPPDSWISKAKFPRQDTRWRPFARALLPDSIKQAMTICNTFLTWLVAAEYLRANPMALVKKRGRNSTKRLHRFLTRDQFLYILDTVELIESDIHRARCRWMVCLLYLTMMRISEVAEARMSDFFRRSSADSKIRWYLAVHGKGDTDAEVPVTSELLSELSRYRTTMGLPAMPEPHEDYPIVLRVEGLASKGMSRSALHLIIKTVIQRTESRLMEAGKQGDAAMIKEASAHWFRHSGGSALADSGANIKEVRDIMRHKSIASTNIYMHTEQDQLSDLMEKAHKLPKRTPTKD